MGLYHSISVINTYRTKVTYDFAQTQILVSAALAKVIERHPILSYGIHGETTAHPSYVPVNEVDLDEKIYYCELNSVDEILNHLEAELDIPWTSQETIPPWKLLVVQHAIVDPTIFYIAFIYHHALADGLSGIAVHESLSQALNELSGQPRLPIERLKRTPGNHSSKLKPCIENLVKFNISWSFLISEALQEYSPSLFRYFFGKKPTTFTGRDCEVSEMIPCQTNLRLLELKADVVKPLLAKCQQKKVARTSLLSVIFVRALALAVPSAEAFIGSIPYSLRRSSGTAYDEMVNQVSALQTEYEVHLLQTLRRSSEIEESIWTAAAHNSSGLQDHLSNCLQDNPVGLLPYVSDHHVFYQKKLGKKREQTFEVSNLGSVQPSASPDDVWNVERVIFAQCAAPVGAALALNVAGVNGGPMTVTFSWQDKIVEDEVVESAVRHFEDMIHALAGQ